MSTIRRALCAATFLTLMGASAPLAAQSLTSSQHFAYVDRRAILEASPGGAAVQAILQREVAAWQRPLKRMSDSLNTMIAAFQKSAGTMSLALKDQKTRELEMFQNALQIQNDSITAVADRRRSELYQPVVDQINLAIEDVRIERGLDIIFDADGGSPIAAANKNLNLDDRVIARLRLMPIPALPPAKPAKPDSIPPKKPTSA